MTPKIDWEALHRAAREAQTRAYAPYSNYPVGAAALTDTGEIVVGANSENASYGLTLCAECGLISHLTYHRLGKIVAFLCYGNKADQESTLTVPCGRCRQLLREHAAPGMLIETPAGIQPFDNIFPESFGPEYLN